MSIDTEHPKYKRDVIKEAICEIRFASSDATPSLAELTGQAYKQVSDTFPNIEPVFDQFELPQAVLESLPPEVQDRVPRARAKFKSADGKQIIQVSRNTFSYHLGGDLSYTSRDNFRTEALKHWASVMPLVKPLHVLRIGLRYINLIPFNDKHPNLKDWLQPSKYLPEEFINSQKGYNARIEFRPSSDEIGIITIADQEAPRGVVFDIDSICTRLHKPEEDLQAVIKGLHERIWDVFSNTKTKTLIDFMKAEK